ncbi:MAG: hypothetical protein APF76_11850 [Desulfitibacter sp. BRH_c19]|nr:MAG: hypothetical protein APF76_11850 [Desulfitibacter sp. BRH_c19]
MANTLVPNQCPPGFFRYVVISGDTIFQLADQLGVDEGLIIANNPLPDPASINPGDVLCLPIPINFPCNAVLHPTIDTPPNATGSILVRQLPDGQQSATVTAFGLPSLANFDGFEALIDIVGIGGFGFPLPQESPSTWAGTVIIPRPLLFAGAQVIVQPVNTQTSTVGSPVLTGDLSECARPQDPTHRFNIVALPTDTLFSLARTFGVSIEQIMVLNPGIVNPNVIFPGQIIAIPLVVPVLPIPAPSPAQYLVRTGDSFFTIARRFGLTVALLSAENPQIVDPNVLSVNQVINLVVTPPLPSPMNTAQLYVSVGETLLSISRRTGVSLEAIIAANPQIVDPNFIQVGQIINLPLD